MHHARSSPALSRDEQVAAWRCWLLFCLLYIYELAHFNLTIDDEFLAQAGICHFAEIGRWVHPLLRGTLWPQVVVPGGPLLLFGAALAVSFVYMLRLFGVARFTAFHYLAFCAFALYPTWIAQLEFSANVLPDAVGVLCVAYAALQSVRWPDAPWSPVRRLRQSFVTVLALAVALGAYQSLGLMYLALVIGAGFMAFVVLAPGQQPAWRDLVRTVARAVLLLALGLLVSLAMAKLVMLACGVQASEYGSSILDVHKALRHPLGALARAVNDTRRLFFSFWRPFDMAAAVFFCTVFLCCYMIVRLTVRGQRWKVGGVLLVLLMTPAALTLVGSTSMTVRTFFAGPAVLLGLLLITHTLGREAWQRRTVLVLAALCAVQGLYVNSVEQARGWLVQRHDQSTAGRIEQAILRLRPPGEHGMVQVNLQGELAFDSIYPAVWTGTTGASFFEWDDGNPHRMLSYMSLVGDLRYRYFQEPAPGEFAAVYARMPVWPAEGSVQRYKQGYLVKLSEPVQKPLSGP